MNWDEFAHWGKHISDWSAEYHKTLGDRPVRAQTAFGDTAAQLPNSPPEGGESMDAIMEDFEAIVMPGITHLCPGITYQIRLIKTCGAMQHALVSTERVQIFVNIAA